jgi:hypothetical protein
VAIARGAILRGRKTGLAVSRKNRPHIDRNLFAIQPVTNSEDFNFQAWQCAVTRCFVSYRWGLMIEG